MENRLGNGRHAFEGDSLPLFDRQGMIGGFEFHEGAEADRARVDMRLQIEGIWVGGKNRGQPPEVRWLLFALRVVPMIEHTLEVLPTQRGPHRPHEGIVSSMDVNLQVALDEKVLPVQDADILFQVSPRRPFCLRDLEPVEGGVCAIGRGQPLVENPAGTAGVAILVNDGDASPATSWRSQP